jgi:hypothetical protein
MKKVHIYIYYILLIINFINLKKKIINKVKWMNHFRNKMSDSDTDSLPEIEIEVWVNI